MLHFRDVKAGRFYLNRDDPLPRYPSETPAFLRFARRKGYGLNLWGDDGIGSQDLLTRADLDWPVDRREVLVLSPRDSTGLSDARGYRALVRPDTEQIMSVVTSAYSVAENQWVARAAEGFARRLNTKAPMIGAVSYGRDRERTLHIARVRGEESAALCLLAYNTHGGEGAVKFHLVEADRRLGTVYVLGTRHATHAVPHVGDMRERLLSASDQKRTDTFVERYVAETEPLWAKLADTNWSPRRTKALIRYLWGDTPSYIRDERTGDPAPLDDNYRHPGHHLPDLLEDTDDAASAYRAVCDWIDNRSEACERGDFTKNRDERLARGAGNKYKRDAWRWILDNT